MARKVTAPRANPETGIEEAEVVTPTTDSADTNVPPSTLPPPDLRGDPVDPMAPAPDPAPQDVRSPPPAPPARQRGILWPVLGGVLAAAIGFGAAQMVPNGWPVAVIRDMAEQSEAQRAEIVRLGAEVGRLSDQPPPPPAPDLTPLSTRLDELTARIAAAEARPAAPDLTPRLDALESRLAVLESLPAGTGEGADPDAVAALLREVAVLRSEVAAQRTAQTDATAEVTAAVDAARAALAQTEAEAQRLRDEAAAAAQAVMVRATAARLAAAVQSGTDLAAPLQDLTAAGVTVPEVLAANATGIPTLAALQAEFPPAARAALDAARRADMGDTFWDRASSLLMSSTGARSLTPRDGDDPDAILSRAEAALRDGNLPATLDELDAMPETGRAPLMSWTSRARLRIDALQAAADLAAGQGG